MAIANEYGVTLEQIQPDSNMRVTLQLDSMRAMTLLLIVKQTTGVMIAPRQLPRLTTFRTLYDYIETHKD